MTAASNAPRVLVACVGNIFFGDDAFGVEVARLLTRRPQPPGVRVVDFGIRGLDMTYALIDGWDAAVIVDAVPRGGAPGTLYLLEPQLDSPGAPGSAAMIDPHSMDPVRVLRAAAAMGDLPETVLIVGCQPAQPAAGKLAPDGNDADGEHSACENGDCELIGDEFADGGADDMQMGLSDPVRAALDEAVLLVESVVRRILGNADGVSAPSAVPPPGSSAALRLETLEVLT